MLKTCCGYVRCRSPTLISATSAYASIALEFAERHGDVAIKVIAVLMADVARHGNLLTDYVKVMSE